MIPVLIILPNGGHMQPGDRQRVPAEDIWLIPVEWIVACGLELEDESASPRSEVIVWPA